MVCCSTALSPRCKQLADLFRPSRRGSPRCKTLTGLSRAGGQGRIVKSKSIRLIQMSLDVAEAASDARHSPASPAQAAKAESFCKHSVRYSRSSILIREVL
ncbi:uncharacterized protein BDZ99DRAFT_109920 [Mytilinidion resinicola]|uniref:Uncharacterized protein n=1 Tax=Mytilinidion resinicola TaxID=574789 RepID=A0A6A6YA51_9PEZI|nr:uncharacterized protein BDZ99DRAFT_109920 [Mytilinidion resinicola]KAF2805702.1 hypothetical protein BDZ99DRAFT_109920 [Mytilinidion resinicola]